MASNINTSLIKDTTSMDDTIQSTLVRPTTIPLVVHNTRDTSRSYNIDNINLSPSPLDPRPRFFQPGTLFDSNTYEKIVSSVYKTKNINDNEEEDDEEEDDDDDDDDDNVSGDEVFDGKALNDERDQEIQHLSQIIRTTQAIDDDLANIIMQQLNDELETTIDTDNDDDNQAQCQSPLVSSIISTTQRPYPPVNQTGIVDHHDRPYADYGHLNRQTIAQECQFNLQPSPSNQSSDRFNAKSFAITSWTNVSKELVMNEIKDEFDIANIQYICISEEISELNQRQHLHIQIIFKTRIDRRKPFLDEITGTCCNYQVTHNDVAWNEYIKKGGNYIEFNEFKSTRKLGQKHWPPLSSASTPAAAAIDNQPLIPRRIATTVRAIAEEKHQRRIQIYQEAVLLAETNVDHAMDVIKHNMLDKFVERGTWYLTIFKYIHLRAQRDADRRGDVDKEYVWPNSFTECTPKLREAMNQWIQHNFFRAKRAKCLILIGPTGTGKTAFALSLPGHINYFQERWNLDIWNDYARYSVYDDIPWDEFTKHNFPKKKNLLTQKWTKISATDKYRESKQIVVRQPAIVLLNPEDAGSLLEEPITARQKNLAEYWKKRAFVYIMGPDEYFYKRRQQRHHGNRNVADDNQVSSGNSHSSMSTNEEHIGGQHEFHKMNQRHKEKHHKQ